jgi:AbrB family looped-hinge helix DNA binding protein
MAAVTISSKGWVVIPAELRRRYALEPGGRVYMVDYGGVIAIVPALDDPVRDSAGLLSGGTSLTDALMAERSAAREREDHEGRS